MGCGGRGYCKKRQDCCLPLARASGRGPPPFRKPAVIAFAGIALGVFVGELRALGRHDGRRRVVLAGDQLDVVFLAVSYTHLTLPTSDLV